MDCADYCVDCDGDTDGDGNDLLHGVLDKKSVLEIFPERFELIDGGRGSHLRQNADEAAESCRNAQILGTDLHGFK